MNSSVGAFGGQTSKDTFFLLSLERPQNDRRIITCRSEPVVHRAPAQPPNSFSVALPCGEIVHIRLKVLNDTTLVGGCNVSTIMAKHDSTNGVVVRLKNGLEVKCQSVPESKLSAR